MTPAEIDALPRPMKPQRDLVLCTRVKAAERKHGSIYLPDDNKIPEIVCRVLDVGDGLVLDKGVIRKPQVKRGDLIITTPNDGHPIWFNEHIYWLYEWSTEVIAVILDETASIMGKEHC